MKELGGEAKTLHFSAVRILKKQALIFSLPMAN